MTLNGTDKEQQILITMSRTGSLYANKRLLAKNCTSFDITPAHIIFTTTQHLIKFVHITSIEGKPVAPEHETTEADILQTLKCPETLQRLMNGVGVSSGEDVWLQ